MVTEGATADVVIDNIRDFEEDLQDCADRKEDPVNDIPLTPLLRGLEKQDGGEDASPSCFESFRRMLVDCDTRLPDEGCSMHSLLGHLKSLTACVNMIGNMLEEEIGKRRNAVEEVKQLKCELNHVRTELQVSQEWQRTSFRQLHTTISQNEHYLQSLTSMYEQFNRSGDSASSSHQSVNETSSSQVTADAMPYGDSGFSKTIRQRKRLKGNSSLLKEAVVNSEYYGKMSFIADASTSPVGEVKQKGGGAEDSQLVQGMQLGDHDDHLVQDVQSETEYANNSIEETLRATAESVVAESGFVYDESSGQYYDWKLKMYYNPSSQLYFDHENGVYYYYDSNKGSYIFHSQIHVKTTDDGKQNILHQANDGEPSDGEIVSDDENVERASLDVEGNCSTTNPAGTVNSVQLCLRIMVVESEKLDIGNLFVITCKGGSIGSKETCTVCIPCDDQVQEVHAYIIYESHDRTFYIKDNETQHGTFINNERLGSFGSASEAVEITHRDYIRMGRTIFSFHVHERETCYDCEPGNIQHILQQREQLKNWINNQDNEQQRKQQNKQLRKKYGIVPGYLPKSLLSFGRDRALDRRKEHGIEAYANVEAPLDKASVLKEIPSHNKGHTMLKKMGWKSGEGLGKGGDGIITPITVAKGEGGKHGYGVGLKTPIDDKDETRSRNLQKTKKRYAQCKQLPE